MVSCFSTKMPGQFKGERRVSSTNDSGTTGYYMQKNEGGLLPHTTYKIQLKMEQWYKYESHNSHIFKNLFLAVQGLCCSDRALSSCSARASHCSGFSCWGARAPGHVGSVVVATGLVALWCVESSGTRDWTHVPCIRRRILIHWTIKEVLQYILEIQGVSWLFCIGVQYSALHMYYGLFDNFPFFFKNNLLFLLVFSLTYLFIYLFLAML